MSGGVQICVVLVPSSGHACMHMTFTLRRNQKVAFPIGWVV